MFNSLASDLVPTDTNNGYDVFVRDLATGTTELLSANAAGTDSLRSWSGVQAVSPDGNLVAFGYNGAELAPGNTYGDFHLFVRDLADGHHRAGVRERRRHRRGQRPGVRAGVQP